jgi:hypothetical protein
MGSIALRAPFGCFTDRAHEPDRASIRRALADARTAWDTLETELKETYGLEGSFHFMYGERYGWALRFRRGDRLILAMYPNRGKLTVQIILSLAQVAAAREMKLPPQVSRVLESARAYPEGRWLFIPVRSKTSAEGLRSLIALKMSRPGKGERGRRAGVEG